MDRSLFIVVILSVCILGGCASTVRRPKLYPNAHLQNVGTSQADIDIDECMRLADNYAKDPDKYQGLAKDAAVNSTIGAGAGALTGTIMKGSIGRSTAAGAAVGAVVTIARGLLDQGSRNPSKDRFVEHCMTRQGYEVYGGR